MKKIYSAVLAMGILITLASAVFAEPLTSPEMAGSENFSGTVVSLGNVIIGDKLSESSPVNWEISSIEEIPTAKGQYYLNLVNPGVKDDVRIRRISKDELAEIMAHFAVQLPNHLAGNQFLVCKEESGIIGEICNWR